MVSSEKTSFQLICTQLYLPKQLVNQFNKAENWAYELTGFYIYTVVSDKGFNGSSADPYCGGTILNEKTILTAAHCFGNQTNQIKLVNQRAYISAGILLFEDAVWSIDQQHVKIQDINLHPQYLENDGNAHNFDAAIVKLNESLKFNTHVEPACLPDEDFEGELIKKHQCKKATGICK